MKHTTEQLIEAVYQFYPIGMSDLDPAYEQSEAHQRLVRARRAGAADPRWEAMLERLRARFPESLVEDWTHLVPQNVDAAHRVRLLVPPIGPAAMHAVVGLASVLAPYYAIYSSRVGRVGAHGATPPDLRWAPTDDEAAYWQALAGELESTFGHEPLPHEIGELVVPDVVAGNRARGEATLYDCLFTDNRW